MAKFLCCADLHIRSNKPQHRMDDYFQSVMKKFSQIIDLSNRTDSNIICAGDFFDNTKVGHGVVNAVLEQTKRLDNNLFLITGQHDRNFHSDDLSKTPIKTLLFQKNIHFINRQKPIKIDDFYIYGCSYGEEPIKQVDKNSILVIHRSITPEKPPFFLKEAIYEKTALKKYKNYSIIIAGDYHVPFAIRRNKKILINCGPMMRSSIDQMDLKPVVWIINTKNRKIQKIKLKVEKAEDVFRLENIKKEDLKFSEELEQLVHTLKDKSQQPNYKNTIDALIEQPGIKKKTRQMVKKLLFEAESNG